MDTRPIAVYDSGVGGLTILRALRAELPRERLLYLADSGFFPYGSRTPAELRWRAELSAGELIRREAKVIVVACNTATVAALAHLRARFPGTPFVGVVPVVKVLAEQSRSGAIALLSTPSTATSPYTAALIARYATGMRVVNVPCAGLAEAIEEGDPCGAQVRSLLIRYLLPVVNTGADVIGLGCTHYPFAEPVLRTLLGQTVRIFDSADAVARRVQAILQDEHVSMAHGRPQMAFLSTGDAQRFARQIRDLLALDAPTSVAHVELDGGERGCSHAGLPVHGHSAVSQDWSAPRGEDRP